MSLALRFFHHSVIKAHQSTSKHSKALQSTSSIRLSNSGPRGSPLHPLSGAGRSLWRAGVTRRSMLCGLAANGAFSICGLILSILSTWESRLWLWLVPARAWTVAGQPLPVLESYKYLGVEFTSNRGRGKWNEFLKRIHKMASLALNSLMWRGGGASGLRPRTYVHLWETEVRPLLEYASQLWEGDRVSEKWVNAGRV